MSENEVDRLRQLLAQAPDNTLLRVGLIRRLVSLDEETEALALALELDLSTIKGTSDRQVLGGLFRRAELFDLASQLNDDSVSMLDDETDPAPAPGGNSGKGKILRLVGGRDAADTVSEIPAPSETTTPLTFADLAGLEEVKRDIHRRIILPFAQPTLVQQFRKRTGGGVLVYGPPGCGKTLLARATAGECGAQFVTAHLSEILDPYIGGSEQRLSAIFRTARSSTPTVLFFDEIDALGARRSTSTSSHIAQLASHFLSEMDGVEASNEGILVLAATNAPWSMDAAFLRPGRFDRMFFVPPPDRIARRRIFELELDGRLTAGDIDLDALAVVTSGRSGADVRAVVERASDDAIDATLDKGETVAINHQSLMTAAKQTRSTVAEWLTTARNHATYSNEGGRYDEILAFLEQHGRRG